MIKNRLPSRTARNSSRGGFTLVELLVVIAIIALLAGLAIGPITNALKIAKESGGIQNAHTLYLADFQYGIANNSNNGNFADGTDASKIADALSNGNFVSDPSIYGGPNATSIPAQTPGQYSLTPDQIAWDFYGKDGETGLGSTDPDQIPLIWSTGTTFDLNPGAAANTVQKSPFGLDGCAVVYKSGSAKFMNADATGKTTDSKGFISSSLPNGLAGYVVRAGYGG